MKMLNIKRKYNKSIIFGSVWPKQWSGGPSVLSQSCLLFGPVLDSGSRQWWIEAVTQWWTLIAAVRWVSHWSQAFWFQSWSRSSHPALASWVAGNSNKIRAKQVIEFWMLKERLDFLRDSSILPVFKMFQEKVLKNWISVLDHVFFF